MRILFITQKMSRYDSALGFTHRWVTEFAKHFERITVICLEKGKYDLPHNVSVLSLGKETGRSRIKYVWNLFRYSISEMDNYDAVFVHMNEEYAALAGWFWRLCGKKVFLWRNHYLPRIAVDIGAVFCHKIFCTSRSSYTAKFKQIVFMPVGVDIDFFKPQQGVARIPNSLLFLARMAPAKRAHILLEALGKLKAKKIPFSADFYGPTLPKDEPYLAGLKKRSVELGLEDAVRFLGASPYVEGPKINSAHEIVVNLSLSGMYDKTIFEAAACETLVLASSLDFTELVDPKFIFPQDNIPVLASKLEVLLKLSKDEKTRLGKEMRSLAVEKHSLDALGKRLKEELTS